MTTYEPTPDGRVTTLSARTIRRIVRVTIARHYDVVPSDEASTSELMRPSGLRSMPGEDVPGTVASIDERGGWLPSDVDNAITTAAERPWTDSTKLGNRTGIEGGYRYLGTATVVVDDGEGPDGGPTMYTKLAPGAGACDRGRDGPEGTKDGGSWKLKVTLGGATFGHAGQRRKVDQRKAQAHRKQHTDKAAKQRAYRKRLRDEAAARGITQAELKAERARARTERTNEWQ